MPKKYLFIILAVLAGAAVLTFFLYQNYLNKSPEKIEEVAPIEVPQTNPFEEAKTNPFKDIKTNPFE